MRVVFMGTPAFAVATLDALHLKRNRDSLNYGVSLVFTQPDRPAGRGRKLTPPPVKARALELGLPVFQPRRVKDPESLERIQAIAPEAIVVVGYGQIIPDTIFNFPKYGCVNVHASLLPKYRGAAPINWAVSNGETVTGVTTMRIAKRLDAGDMLLKREVEIGADETAAVLSARLAPIGAELLLESLDGLESGTIVAEQQDDDQATFAPILKREDGWIDWTLSARQIFDRIRGFEPWPGTYTSFRGKRLHIRKAHPANSHTPATPIPRVIATVKQGFLVGCGNDSALAVEEVQLEGKNRISSNEFRRGYRLADGEKLGEPLE